MSKDKEKTGIKPMQHEVWRPMFSTKERLNALLRIAAVGLILAIGFLALEIQKTAKSYPFIAMIDNGAARSAELVEADQKMILDRFIREVMGDFVTVNNNPVPDKTRGRLKHVVADELIIQRQNLADRVNTKEYSSADIIDFQILKEYDQGFEVSIEFRFPLISEKTRRQVRLSLACFKTAITTDNPWGLSIVAIDNLNAPENELGLFK